MSSDGRKYAGRYAVERLLGSGGMAEVYLARDELLGRPVALKVLHSEYARDGGFIERFRREAQSAARLNDPKVVSIYDWGSDDGVYYIVMEYVDGRTLREAVQADGHLTAERSLEITADVCDALHLAHEQGIVHRDVKPGNILLTDGGLTKVTDFGIARAASATGQTVTQTGTVIGTAAYLSPEQAQGQPVDARSDVYSASIVLWEMLTGRVPFSGDTPVAIAYKHVTETPLPPSRFNPDVTPDIDAVVMRGLAKNPDNRYASASEMAADLRRLIKGDPPTGAIPLLDDDETALARRADHTAVVGAIPYADRTQAIPVVDERDPRKGLTTALVALLIIGLLVGLGVLLFTLFSGDDVTRVDVPNVLGKTPGQANELLVDAGFKVDIRDGEGEAIPSDHSPGTIARQEPEAGQKRAEGETVTLYLSSGPEMVAVPKVTGLNEDEATEALEKVGLTKGAVRRAFSNDVEEGRVISQDPAADSRVAPGSAVAITISGGKEKVKVPEVTRLSEEAARDRITALGLTVKVSPVCQKNQNDNSVVDQNPPAGTDVEQGSEVTISVNDIRTVPNVVNKTEEQARAELTQAGFKVQVVRVPSPTGDGTVTDQDPDGGTVACEGDTVTITVEE